MKRSETKRVLYRTLTTDPVEYTFFEEKFACKPCYYCGMPATCADHAPSLACVEILLENGVVEPKDLVTVPACAECNRWLGSSRHLAAKRKAIVKAKLAKKLKGRSRCDWSAEELNELGPNLRREVTALQGYVDIHRYRFNFHTPLRELS